MASNAKTRARTEKGAAKKVNWWAKFNADMEKIRSTGDFPTHYVGGGQAYTKGKKTCRPSQ